jgi:hypothetical protein
MFRSLVLLTLIVATAAPAQVTSYRTINPAPIKGDSNKLVCQKEETIGTRLGDKKICLTVSEWNDRKRDQRERTEQIQAGTCQVGEGQACLDPR